MLFYTLPTKSVITDELTEYSRRNDLVWSIRKDADLSSIPLEMLDTDPVLKRLKEKFSVDPFLVRQRANTFYHWHQDAQRACALNMSLGTYKSHTIFTEATSLSAMCNIEELVYRPNEMTLLNVKKFHSVLNLETDRIIFTMSFFGQVPIEEVIEFCNAEGF